MKEDDDDRALRDRFAAQRDDDARRAPGFGTTLARARARGGRAPWRLLLAGAALAAAAVVVLVVPRPPLSRPTPSADVPSITEWKSPTDFLLATPGREVLGAPPRLGFGFAEPDLSQRRTSS